MELGNLVARVSVIEGLLQTLQGEFREVKQNQSDDISSAEPENWAQGEQVSNLCVPDESRSSPQHMEPALPVSPKRRSSLKPADLSGSPKLKRFAEIKQIPAVIGFPSTRQYQWRAEQIAERR
jgi:hypothetical protein